MINPLVIYKATFLNIMRVSLVSGVGDDEI